MGLMSGERGDETGEGERRKGEIEMVRGRKSGQVDEDVTGLVEVRRRARRRVGGRKGESGESCKTVQIFDGARAITMEMALSDKMSDIAERSVCVAARATCT